MPITPVTREAEIRTAVLGQLVQKVSKTPSQSTSQTWWYTIIPATEET
jgi:hypothetical protein